MSVEGKSRALLLRLRPYSETSLIVHWLTDDAGLISTLAKGARRPKSPFRGKLDLFFEAQISYQKSRAGNLHILKEALVTSTCTAVRQSIDALALAGYATQLLESNVESDTEIQWAFDLFRELLEALNSTAYTPVTLIGLEWKFLNAMGVAPSAAEMKISAGARELLLSADPAPFAASRAQSVPAHVLREAAIQVFRLADASGIRLPKTRAKLLKAIQ